MALVGVHAAIHVWVAAGQWGHFNSVTSLMLTECLSYASIRPREGSCRSENPASPRRLLPPRALLPLSGKVSQVPCLSAFAGRPLLPLPALPPLPANITTVLGKPGESCGEACRGAGRTGTPQHLASVNDCNALRENFPCEAGK